MTKKKNGNSNGNGGTALATIPASDFAALSATGDLKESMDALAAVGETITPQDLVRVKTPAEGGTEWEIPGPAGVERTPELVGALVYWQKCGLLWPSNDPVKGQLPVLRTWDLITAEQVGPIPDDMIETLEQHRAPNGTFKWLNLPYNQWGTGLNGVGKRCKEQRMMFLLRKTDAYPLLVIVQPGSLKLVVAWFKQITQQLGIPWYRAIVRLTLKQTTSKGGIVFSQIVPEVVGVLSPEDGAVIKKTWTEKLATIARQVEVEPEDSDD